MIKEKSVNYGIELYFWLGIAISPDYYVAAREYEAFTFTQKWLFVEQMKLKRKKLVDLLAVSLNSKKRKTKLAR